MIGRNRLSTPPPRPMLPAHRSAEHPTRRAWTSTRPALRWSLHSSPRTCWRDSQRSASTPHFSPRTPRSRTRGSGAVGNATSTTPPTWPPSVSRGRERDHVDRAVTVAAASCFRARRGDRRPRRRTPPAAPRPTRRTVASPEAASSGLASAPPRIEPRHPVAPTDPATSAATSKPLRERSTSSLVFVPVAVPGSLRTSCLSHQSIPTC